MCVDDDLYGGYGSIGIECIIVWAKLERCGEVGMKEDYNLPDVPEGLISLGKMKPKTLITTLFFTGIVGIIWYSILIGKYIYITNVATIEMDRGVYSIVAFLAGVVCCAVLLIIWKVVCELLLLIFNALNVYILRRE
jgi:hypothetical protein